MTPATMNDNPHLKRLEQLEKARKLWQESEWRLNFLRRQTGTPIPEFKDEEMFKWYQQIQQHQ
jgi:hypothetical protein